MVGHVLSKTIESNWKIFWENYNECLHCPGVHPRLSSLVPIYGRGLLEERDDPDWSGHAADPDPKYKGGLRAGAATWSTDGQAAGAPFSGLSEEDRKAGPRVHDRLAVDVHRRPCRLRARGAAAAAGTGADASCGSSICSRRETLADPGFDMRNVVDFTNLVMTEDAEVCELNQRGLHAAPHARGVVMPEEYVIRQFHEWVGSELARA